MALSVLRPPAVRDHTDLYERDATQFMQQVADIEGLIRSTVTAVLTTAATRVPHNLGRQPVAWVVVDKNAQADVWREGSANSDTIPLRASATVTVTLQLW